MSGLFAFCNRFLLWFNPRRWLTLMLYALMLGFVLFICFDRGFIDPYLDAMNVSYLKKSKPELEPPHWLVALGVVFAAAGWMISNMVAMRTSVKQHTINTLLQTRLSATYMAEAEYCNAFLIGQGFNPKNPAPLSLIEDPTQPKNMVAVDYILNFLEFLAVGIRHGDLHEKVLKDAMRRIVVNFAKTTSIYIDAARDVVDGKARSPRVYENLIWLRDRWDD